MCVNVSMNGRVCDLVCAQCNLRSVEEVALLPPRTLRMRVPLPPRCEWEHGIDS